MLYKLENSSINTLLSCFAFEIALKIQQILQKVQQILLA